MKRIVGLVCLMGILSVGMGMYAQEMAAPASEGLGAIRILVVDETKTFLSTMRVAGIVGTLKQMPGFEVDVQFEDAATTLADPLADTLPSEEAVGYDIVVIIPRGIDDASIGWIWIVSDWLPALPPQLQAGVAILSQVIDQVFADVATGIDVTEDLYPNILWSEYVVKGWIR